MFWIRICCLCGCYDLKCCGYHVNYLTAGGFIKEIFGCSECFKSRKSFYEYTLKMDEHEKWAMSRYTW